MSGHGYRLGDIIRVSDGCGVDVAVVIRVEPDDYEGEQPVRVSSDGREWWPHRDHIIGEPVRCAHAPVTGGQLAMSHAKAWQIRAAKATGLPAATLREYADLLDSAVTP
jgi:hypothetical protein